MVFFERGGYSLERGMREMSFILFMGASWPESDMSVWAGTIGGAEKLKDGCI